MKDKVVFRHLKGTESPRHYLKIQSHHVQWTTALSDATLFDTGRAQTRVRKLQKQEDYLAPYAYEYAYASFSAFLYP